MYLSFNTLISGNLSFTRRLIEEKVRIRILEQQINLYRFQPLQSDSVASVETSNILIAAYAYPICSETAGLRDSRLNKIGAG